jgi:hypothetical protein
VRLPLRLCVIGVVAMASTRAFASPIIIAAPGFERKSDTGGNCNRTMTFEWIWAGLGPTPSFIDLNAQPWGVFVSDHDGVDADAGKRQVRASAKHNVGCEAGEAGNPNGDMFLQTAMLGRPSRGAAAAQIEHDGGQGKHSDIAKLTVDVKAAGTDNPSATLRLEMLHNPNVPKLTPSYRNLAGGNVNVSFYPSYRRTDNGLPVNRPDLVTEPQQPPNNVAPVHPQKDFPGSITVKNEQGQDVEAKFSDYTVIVTGSPRSETTVAFLGFIDGLFTELDIGLAALLFAGADEFLLPELISDSHDLYIGVDLTQWLSFPIPFGAGDQFTFINGISDLLPGFFVATSLVGVLPGIGYAADQPFTGNATVRGAIDGQAPEPATLALLGIGAVAYLARARWREALTTAGRTTEARSPAADD